MLNTRKGYFVSPDQPSLRAPHPLTGSVNVVGDLATGLAMDRRRPVKQQVTPSRRPCEHGLLECCLVCDTPIPYVLTDAARVELHAARLRRWHDELGR